MRAWLINLCTTNILLFGFASQATAIVELPSVASEDIAVNALRVAQATSTTGYCYAAICKALKPLNVNLYGPAAYQAKDILIKDQRFLPITIKSADFLQRGDIIVFDRSASHPYGHISVYLGNDTEASDHVAKIAKHQAYGGATVFRVREEWSIDGVPLVVAPDFGTRFPTSFNRVEPKAVPQSLPVIPAAGVPAPGRGISEPLTKHDKSMLASTGGYVKSTAAKVTSSLFRRCINVLFN
ncbi:MAG: hypothetical protein K2W82_07670 [Candidatus Obscuribacterales bacterium]|nr:hypothetical protein [Candidatus Obscuribacterales bacterium]